MSLSFLKKILVSLVLVSSFFLINLEGLAQAYSSSELEELCQGDKVEEKCNSLSASKCREFLEECEKYFQQKAASIEKDLTKTQEEKKTLQNEIYFLRNKIQKLDYEIYQSNIMIKDLGLQIEDTSLSIEETSLQIEESKDQLANILREIYEQDQKSTIEILLAEEKLSDFFGNLVALEEVNSENRELLVSIKDLKNYLQSQRQSLDQEKGDLENLVTIQSLQKQESQSVKNDQEYLLRRTEGEEAKYQQYLAETQQRAAEIRSRIFELIGVPEAPTFGEALDMARYVESVTGIRPALLLAVMTQESNIGKNVGQCYLKNPSTGEGVVAYNGKEVSRVMKPTRDVQPFLSITKELGRDPYNTLVSCPMQYGWGGAMGPAQFIPSTWNIYRGRVADITGRPGDPWNIKDAFLAAGLYLSDYGGANQTYNSEWKAAMIYFSGSTNVKYRFYGDSVMGLAQKYQTDIETIEKGS